MQAQDNFDTMGIVAHVAAVFCRCGWLTVESCGVYHCGNVRCPMGLRPFRIAVVVEPLGEGTVN